MKALRIVIVDDEPPARALLREYLSAETSVEVVAECANGFEAVKTISESAPDVVILDVQMPKLSGFEVLELLDPEPAVIFCTAYDEYALRAFEVHAVDYLLKPFGRERLAEALARVRARLGGTPRHTALSAAARRPGQWLERIVVRDGAQVHVIPLDQVEWIEAQDDYIAIHALRRAHLKHQTLAELADALDPARFVRVHRSHVVAVEHIARIELVGKDQRVAILRDGHTVPVSRSGHERLREILA